MQTPEPFPITTEDRAKAVAALMLIIETGEPSDQIEAAAVLVSMVEQNMQATDNAWFGKPCQN